MKPLAERLCSRRSDVFEAALEEAALRASDGDGLLAGAFGSASSRYQRVGIAAALGETAGPAGLEALREALTARGTGSVDLRCAALIALARRVGEAASEDFATCAADKNVAVRQYAVFCLAACGDDRAWGLVLKFVRQRALVGFSEAVTYLCRRSTRRRGRPPIYEPSALPAHYQLTVTGVLGGCGASVIDTPRRPLLSGSTECHRS
ncbi:HEAT repeat domain-containing protein [Cryptosporangium minutisporangium]|uniref:HEAT repeat domain-containing protein n=1 Tax=Cryptosporangium minutisporangium TaxID=113569 RepID=A0ABP6SPV6_9ACTN